MKYSLEKQEQYSILTLLEENLNSLRAPDLKSEFIVLFNAGTEHLILNLEQVKYVDSSGLSAILTGHRLWTEAGGAFILAGATHPSVKMLINVSRLNNILNLKDNQVEAVRAVMAIILHKELQKPSDLTEEEEV